MGEIYRADDLKIGQTVALKFLPEAVAGAHERIARLQAEVRLARQVSHPSVCRVYDLSDAGDHQFISMEFVDGEDLASLLKRIGRLPSDKAVELARQLCAGLAAAHDAGILHRDLKPANVMIDGRGRVRITDFGLAALAGGVEGGELRAGTPIYMAPEQLAGKEVTVRSDLYSLGLVLYEMFTGKPALKADTPASLARLHETSAPASPGSVLPGIDPAVERAILRCLERDPRERPASALAVAAALPGGDPLAAALAAGETPSPEMVAAAGETGGLRPAAAWTLLGAFLVLSALGIAGARWTKITGWIRLDKPPEVLAERARDVLRTLGHTTPAADTAYGFQPAQALLDYVAGNHRAADRWRFLESGRPPGALFWYRQSPRLMVAAQTFSVVTDEIPPMIEAGMARVVLDPEGRLVSLDVIPSSAEPAQTGGRPDWDGLLRETPVDAARFQKIEPTFVPPVYCDERTAWEGVYEGDLTLPLRIEACAHAGRFVYFRVQGPWSPEPDAAGAARAPAGGRLPDQVRIFLQMAAIAGALLLARRNLRAGRGDRAGAFKITAYFVVVHVLVWALWASHVPDLSQEWRIFSIDTGWTLFNAAQLWIFYVALEPYVRRRWPDAIISWSRLLAGRARDPLVGRDVLLGCVTGAVVTLLMTITLLAPSWLGRPPAVPLTGDLNALDAWHKGANVLDGHLHALLDCMQALFLLLLLRILLRRQWLAAAAFVLVFTPVTLTGLDLAIAVPMGLLGISIFAFTLVRFGLLAAVVALFSLRIHEELVYPPGFGAWYMAGAVVSILAVVGLAVYGFYTSLAGRAVFRPLVEEAFQE